MSVAAMREALRNAPKYKHAFKWIEKVNNMHDDQVIAVYYRMLRGHEL